MTFACQLLINYCAISFVYLAFVVLSAEALAIADMNSAHFHSR
jgi:hypothetical protein